MERRVIVVIGAAVGVLLLAGVASVSFWARLRVRQERATAQVAYARAVEAAAAAEWARRAATREALDALGREEGDPDVVRSIAGGLKISAEAQGASEPAGEFLLTLNLEKPLGRRYLVDDPAQTCILHADRRPWVVLSAGERSPDPRVALDADLGSQTILFRVRGDQAPPPGAELRVEWRNHDPRTGVVESLWSDAFQARR